MFFTNNNLYTIMYFTNNNISTKSATISIDNGAIKTINQKNYFLFLSSSAVLTR